MLNQIRSEIYKLLRLRSTLVIAVVIVAYAVLTGYMIKVIEDMTASLTPEQIAQMQEGAASASQGLRLGIYANPEALEAAESDSLMGATVESVIDSQMNGGMFQLFVAIFTVLFVCADFKNGYIKNLDCTGAGKLRFVAAKSAVLALYVLVMYALYNAVGLASTMLFSEKEIAVSSTDVFVKVVLIQFLLHLAFAFLVGMLCIVVRSIAFSMTAGVLLASGLVAMAFGFFDIIANRAFGVEDPDTAIVSLSRAISDVVSTADDTVMQRGIIVGAVYAAVAFAVSMAAMQKKDVC